MHIFTLYMKSIAKKLKLFIFEFFVCLDLKLSFSTLFPIQITKNGNFISGLYKFDWYSMSKFPILFKGFTSTFLNV